MWPDLDSRLVSKWVWKIETMQRVGSWIYCKVWNLSPFTFHLNAGREGNRYYLRYDQSWGSNAVMEVWSLIIEERIDLFFLCLERAEEIILKSCWIFRLWAKITLLKKSSPTQFQRKYILTYLKSFLNIKAYILKIILKVFCSIFGLVLMALVLLELNIL